MDSSVELNAAAKVSVVIPAFNEAGYLRATLQALIRSAEILKSKTGISTEIIVVDNDSKDSTADIALLLGAKVVCEIEHNISRVRNKGAAATTGEFLVFVDADTLLPEALLTRIFQCISKEVYVGGAVDTLYQPRKLTARIYLGLWRVLGRMTGMAQGATQFCRRKEFESLGGYNEAILMGEDVDFYFRLKALAKANRTRTCLVTDMRVVPSPRRFDNWPFWKTLIWTNPMLIAFLKKSTSVWKGWYRDPPR